MAKKKQRDQPQKTAIANKNVTDFGSRIRPELDAKRISTNVTMANKQRDQPQKQQLSKIFTSVTNNKKQELPKMLIFVAASLQKTTKLGCLRFVSNLS
jgi:hypothetical protein